MLRVKEMTSLPLSSLRIVIPPATGIANGASLSPEATSSRCGYLKLKITGILTILIWHKTDQKKVKGIIYYYKMYSYF